MICTRPVILVLCRYLAGRHKENYEQNRKREKHLEESETSAPFPPNAYS